MKCSLCILLPLQDDINEFRTTHGQTTPPHITLLYRTETDAIDHIKDVLKNFKPFTITLNALGRSEQEHFLYLLPENPDPLLKLHAAIHSGPLEHEHNVRMPKYLPHLTLGEFASDAQLKKHRQLFSQTATITECAYLTHEEDGSVIKQERVPLGTGHARTEDT